MSWSVSAIGKAPAVATKLAEDFARQKCTEPEETIKNTVASAIATALAASPANFAVRAEASGSQSQSPEGTTNQLAVKLEPIWGFAE